MKSYIQGLITGGVLVFAFMVLMGASAQNSETGKYHPMVWGKLFFLVDTTTGDVYKASTDGAQTVWKKIKYWYKTTEENPIRLVK